jgi:ribosomal protein S18 acetylase RimI-like enzyme
MASSRPLDRVRGGLRALVGDVRARLGASGAFGRNGVFGGPADFLVYAKRMHRELDSGGVAGEVGEWTDRIPEGDGDPTEPDATSSPGELPDGVSLRVERASDIDVRPGAGFLELSPGDYAVMASADDEVVGWVFVRVERPVVVDRPGVSVTFDGAYLWGLYVDPPHRGRGLGAALLSAATAFVERGRSTSAFALVDAENDRSSALFDRLEYAMIDEIAVTRRQSLRDRFGGEAVTRRYEDSGW